MTYALIAYFVSIGLDIWSTRHALAKNSRATEANPVIAKLMNLFGPMWWLAKLVVGIALAAVVYRLGDAWPLWVLAGVYSLVAAMNLRASQQ